jgi:hypothetical protein
VTLLGELLQVGADYRPVPQKTTDSISRSFRITQERLSLKDTRATVSKKSAGGT